VQPGDEVVIQGSTLAEPLLDAVFTRALQAGGHPKVLVWLPRAKELKFRHASDEQLRHIHAVDRAIVETPDVWIRIRALHNTKALSNVDPARLAPFREWEGTLINQRLNRAAAGDMRWVGTLYPTHAYAQDADMSLQEYEDFVYGACLPDLDDPIGWWKRLSAWQQRIVDWFEGKDQVHVIGPETDLRLSVAGRTFINSDGKRNMPSGEVFTGPVEDSVEGHVYFSFPAITEEREVAGVRLRFERGRVVDASAEKNEDFLVQKLATDEGAPYVGEFAIGTNAGIDRFVGQILFDEKINGTFHIALGAGYPETGSRNRSKIHWDMVCDLRDGGEIWVDGELLYQNGDFVVDFGPRP
jgi:aminopeptidase